MRSRTASLILLVNAVHVRCVWTVDDDNTEVLRDFSQYLHTWTGLPSPPATDTACVAVISRGLVTRTGKVSAAVPSIRTQLLEPLAREGFNPRVHLISSKDDFGELVSVLGPKFVASTTIAPTRHNQLKRLCAIRWAVAARAASEGHCAWWIKTRPDLELLEPFSLRSCCYTFSQGNGSAPTAAAVTKVLARAREYRGPVQLQYGASVGGPWEDLRTTAIRFTPTETHVVPDDQFMIVANSATMSSLAERALGGCCGPCYGLGGDAQGHQLGERFTERMHWLWWKGRGVAAAPLSIKALLHREDKSPRLPLAPSGPINLPTDAWQRSFEGLPG